jgi:hypothetical protein
VIGAALGHGHGHSRQCFKHIGAGVQVAETSLSPGCDEQVLDEKRGLSATTGIDDEKLFWSGFGVVLNHLQSSWSPHAVATAVPAIQNHRWRL